MESSAASRPPTTTTTTTSSSSRSPTLSLRMSPSSSQQPPSPTTGSNSSSPRNRGQQQYRGLRLLLHRVYRFYVRRNFRFVLLCHLPLLLILQWNMQRHDSVFFSSESSIAVAQQQQQQQVVGVAAAGLSHPSPPRTRSSAGNNDTGTGAGTMMKSGDVSAPAAAVAETTKKGASYNHGSSSGHDRQPARAEQPKNTVPSVVPPTLSRPHPSAPPPPLSVVLLGTKESAEQWLDALDRSEQVRVLRSVTYSPTLRRSHVETYWHNTSGDVEEELSPMVVYIVDWAALARDCHALQRMLSDNSTAFSVTTETTNTPTYLLYLDTSHSARTVSCPFAKRTFPPNRTRYAKGNMVRDRYWNHTKQWTEPGTVINQTLDQQQEESIMGGPILHAPQYLREAFVEQLYNVTTALGANVSSLVKSKRRKTDAAHFWRKGGNLEYAFLRRRISADIVALGEHRKKEVKRWLVRVLGDDSAVEQNRVSFEYVKQMVSTKVVVIAQHDEWEDHYRLMEALASGAMVMSDVMLSPPRGLEDGVNIVFYDSPASFERLLLYYLHPENEKKRLQIAQNGMEFALGRQRGWHRIEELLFGEALTGVDRPFAPAPERKHTASVLQQ